VWAQSHQPDSAPEVIVTDSPDAVTDPPDQAGAAPDATDAPDGGDETALPTRSAATDSLWEEVGIQPVSVALPPGRVGYTLRAYRPAGQLTPTEAPAEEAPEDDPFAERERARAAEEAELAGGPAFVAGDVGLVEDTGRPGRTVDPETGEPVEEPAPEDFQDEPEGTDETDQTAAEPAADEEVPVFLSHRGRLLLFATPESLVAFIGSDAPHDLTQLDTWSTVVKRVGAADVVPTEDDTYELDLVVENLRGGHDAWDLPLLIAAGELARDLGWALRLEQVITALAPGSPLDDLDEALRAAASGGLGGVLGRRRLRRIGAQQASLGWRTVIGKISAAVDWRD
jgi:hypothetical protein